MTTRYTGSAGAAATDRRPLVTRKQVADFTGIAVQTLAVMAMQGRGPKFIKLESGRVRYRWSDVEAWLDTQAVGGGAA